MMDLALGVIGAMVVATGLLLLVAPESLCRFLEQRSDANVLRIGSAVASLAFGAVLVWLAEGSSYVFLVMAIGLLSMMKGLFILVISQDDFKEIVSWVAPLLQKLGRPFGAGEALLGGFLLFLAA